MTEKGAVIVKAKPEAIQGYTLAGFNDRTYLEAQKDGSIPVIPSPYHKNQTFGNDEDRAILLRFQIGSVIGRPYYKNQTRGNDRDRVILLRFQIGFVIGNAVRNLSKE